MKVEAISDLTLTFVAEQLAAKIKYPKNNN